jgi:tetratricopeptide (TPR) repeat protein
VNRMARRRALLCIVPAVVALTAPARAMPVSSEPPPLCMRNRGIDVTTALLMEYYQLVPERRDAESAKAWAARLEEGLKKFQANVGGRYAEGTLQRLADHPDPQTRQAALLALHLLGTMASNEAIAERLRDENRQVRQMAADALWALWFRADGEANHKELQKALQQSDPKKGAAALTALIRKAPGFAEAYNQRGILYFQMQEYDKCATDCQKALQLNTRHFGAAAGLGRCYLRLRLPEPALKAFRTAYEINPNLEGVQDAIRDLESVLGNDEK